MKWDMERREPFVHLPTSKHTCSVWLPRIGRKMRSKFVFFFFFFPSFNEFPHEQQSQKNKKNKIGTLMKYKRRNQFKFDQIKEGEHINLIQQSFPAKLTTKFPKFFA